MELLLEKYKVISITWILFALLYLLLTSDCYNLLSQNCKLIPPNEMGDFLSGFFAPLAFLGLIVTIYQQKVDSQALLKIEIERNKVLEPHFILNIENYKRVDVEQVENPGYWLDLDVALFNTRGTAIDTKVFVKRNGVYTQFGEPINVIERFEKKEIQLHLIYITPPMTKNQKIVENIRIDAMGETGEKFEYYFNLIILEINETTVLEGFKPLGIDFKNYYSFIVERIINE